MPIIRRPNALRAEGPTKIRAPSSPAPAVVTDWTLDRVLLRFHDAVLEGEFRAKSFRGSYSASMSVLFLSVLGTAYSCVPSADHSVSPGGYMMPPMMLTIFIGRYR